MGLPCGGAHRSFPSQRSRLPPRRRARRPHAESLRDASLPPRPLLSLSLRRDHASDLISRSPHRLSRSRRISTVDAICSIAKSCGAKAVLITAQPERGSCVKHATDACYVPRRRWRVTAEVRLRRERGRCCRRKLYGDE